MLEMIWNVFVFGWHYKEIMAAIALVFAVAVIISRVSDISRDTSGVLRQGIYWGIGIFLVLVAWPVILALIIVLIAVVLYFTVQDYIFGRNVMRVR